MKQECKLEALANCKLRLDRKLRGEPVEALIGLVDAFDRRTDLRRFLGPGEHLTSARNRLLVLDFKMVIMSY